MHASSSSKSATRSSSVRSARPPRTRCRCNLRPRPVMANRSDEVRETLRISARADYAIRATAAIAAVPEGQLVTADALSSAQAIPLRFLLAILNNLRQAGIIESRRGHGGGDRLGRPGARAPPGPDI